MDNLLNAVNTDPNRFLINELPIKSDDVSIVTMEELYNFFEDSFPKDSDKNGYDVAYPYNTYDYYVYGIVGDEGLDSTLDNLRSVGINWYRQKNKAISEDYIISLNGINVFGGPLYHVCSFDDDLYHFNWRYANGKNIGMSYNPHYWGCRVPGNVYVVIVRR